MYQNDYTLQQLLELALRVPEVGAVNFNILYHILRTVIEKQGLGGIKPEFSFETPLILQKTKSKEVSLKRSHSAESLQTVDRRGVSKGSEKKDFPEKRAQDDTEKASTKWNKIKFFKRLDAVEEEISEFHIMISQLVDKIANFERVLGLQETHVMKEIANLQHSIKSTEEIHNLARKVENLSSDVSVLKSKTKLKSETEESSSEEVSDYTELEESKVESKEKIQKPSHPKPKKKEQEITLPAKYEKLFDEFNAIKKHLKLEPSVYMPEKLEKPVPEEHSKDIKDSSEEHSKDIKDSSEEHSKNIKYSSEEHSKDIKDFVEVIKDSEKTEKKDSIIQENLLQSDIDLLNISVQVTKLMEKCAAIDKMFSSDISSVKEKNLIMEQTLNKCDGEIESLKTNWDELVHSFESVKENLQYIENQMTVLTEIPGLENRVEQLEGYVYTGYEQEREVGVKEKRIMRPHAVTPADKLIPKAEKVTEKIRVPDKKEVEIFKPIFKKPERTKAQGVEEYYLDQDGEIVDTGSTAGTPHRRFLAVSRNIALIRDMEKKKHAPKFQAEDLYEHLEEEDDYMYSEPVYEIAQKQDEDFGESSGIVSTRKMTTEYSAAEVKTSTFTSPDILEEHSRQLRGQVIVFVKKRLHVFEIDLQHIESNLVTMKKKIEVLEKSLKETGEKLMFVDANFSQRAGDLAALKEMAENYQVSIAAIMHHLDRKAEAFAVNQKVSRKELTVIEDRVVKLCVTTSSEIAKLEERISDSLEKFCLELDKKLFTEEFEVRSDFLLHKIKILDNKLKDAQIEGPKLEFEGIRPVEIKKFVLCKDGTRVKQARKKITSWKHSPTSESIIPVLTQHLADREASPKTAIQIQKELEQASIPESKRYVEGAYTKIHFGRQ